MVSLLACLKRLKAVQVGVAPLCEDYKDQIIAEDEYMAAQNIAIEVQDDRMQRRLTYLWLAERACCCLKTLSDRVATPRVGGFAVASVCEIYAAAVAAREKLQSSSPGACEFKGHADGWLSGVLDDAEFDPEKVTNRVRRECLDTEAKCKEMWVNQKEAIKRKLAPCLVSEYRVVYNTILAHEGPVMELLRNKAYPEIAPPLLVAFEISFLAITLHYADVMLL